MKRLVRLPVLSFRQIAYMCLCYLTARWREGGGTPFIYFSREAGQAEVAGRAQTRRQGVPWVYWVVSWFKGKHGETEAWWLELWASPWTSLSLNLVIYQMETTPAPHITEFSHRHEIHFSKSKILWGITSCLPLTSLFLPDLSLILGSHWFQQSWCCRPCVRQKMKQTRKWKSMIPYPISQAYSQTHS